MTGTERLRPSPEAALRDPTSRPWRRLVSHSGWNLLGQAATVAAALASIPVLIGNLGAATFGIFSVYLALIGYFGLLDFGIGRAVTAEVARHQLRHDDAATAHTTGTAVTLLMVVGITIALALLAFKGPIANSFGQDDPSLREDIRNSLWLLSLAVPLAIATSAVRGALEGLQAFRVISQITMPTGALMFAAPALVSFGQPSLWAVTGALLVVRLLALVMFWRAARGRVRDLSLGPVDRHEARRLLRAGGWITVSNVISPLMTNLDRVLIGTQLSPVAVAQYVTPYEAATKVLIPSGAVANASFPEFARLSERAEDKPLRRRYFWRASLLTFVAALLPALVVMAFAQQILSLWISESFAQDSHQVMQILAAGVAINGAAYIPFAFIQGMGRADVTAKFHLFEFCLYLPAFFALVGMHGIEGAAMAWVGRVVLDACLLFGYAIGKLK